MTALPRMNYPQLNFLDIPGSYGNRLRLRGRFFNWSASER
jgi:hypothetical protein